MGDWVDIGFRVKPTLMDESFLKRMDDCFAAVNYHPAPGWVLHSRDDKAIPPSDRLAAMDEAKFWQVHGSPDDWMTAATWTYSPTGELNNAFHIWLLIYKDARYVTSITLKTHVTSFYFLPECVVAEDDPEELKEHTRTCLTKVDVVKNLIPIIHEKFWAYNTGALTDNGLLLEISRVKETILPFWDGKGNDTFPLCQTVDGSWVCPVCCEAHLEKPPWFISADPKTPWAEPSFQKCPACQTQFGVDDNLRAFPEINQGSLWGKLQRKWLKRKQISP